MRSDHSEVQHDQFGIQRIRVVGFVANDPVQKLNKETPLQRFSDQGHFMRRTTGRTEGDRKTMPVCNDHDFGVFASLGFTNANLPFFAGENDPSMNASRMSCPPRPLISWARIRSISSNMHSLDHFWCQRRHIWYGGYRFGKSFQGAPVRNIQRMPSIISRRWRRGRAQGSDQLDRGGLKGVNRVQGMICSMSRKKGDCLEKAPMKSWFQTLKTELVNHRDYWTRRPAKADILNI
jgi:hypothetical protein